MSNQKKNPKKTSLLLRLKTVLERNRLGELLVISGLLTTNQLKFALKQQKAGVDPLGRVLVQQRMVSQHQLRKALLKQGTMRCLAAAITIMISFSSFTVKPAKAGPIKDIPPQIKLVSVANSAFTKINRYPDLFGTTEQASYNLEPFTKWTGMFERFETAMNNGQDRAIIENWKQDLMAYKNLSLYDMASKVNHLINSQKYIVDSRNWGQSDYWETPIEFFKRGGDCEDFAIAKYTSLRALGVPEERLRIAIVHDKIKDIPHAVLIVYTDRGAIMLDNQMANPVYTSQTERYRPIFSINRQAWWLHKAPSATVLASAR